MRRGSEDREGGGGGREPRTERGREGGEGRGEEGLSRTTSQFIERQ